ncbi:hypothetical protein NC651_030773 [Populus alba x Populus x berolinensis]|nr:hypothetical protein NC651_030773 [Populus alba x Populus x berolinensis]
MEPVRVEAKTCLGIGPAKLGRPGGSTRDPPFQFEFPSHFWVLPSISVSSSYFCVSSLAAIQVHTSGFFNRFRRRRNLSPQEKPLVEICHAGRIRKLMEDLSGAESILRTKVDRINDRVGFQNYGSITTEFSHKIMALVLRQPFVSSYTLKQWPILSTTTQSGRMGSIPIPFVCRESCLALSQHQERKFSTKKGREREQNGQEKDDQV